ncbi:hypothetical protein HanIR_Chr15g0770271 [Helianthus annuus]|nr:hypothetical protein HanIR_Chr15g0770271 [Helianthus annuus]
MLRLMTGGVGLLLMDDEDDDSSSSSDGDQKWAAISSTENILFISLSSPPGFNLLFFKG